MVLNTLVYIAMVIIVIIVIVLLLRFLFGVLFVAPIGLEPASTFNILGTYNINLQETFFLPVIKKT